MGDLNLELVSNFWLSRWRGMEVGRSDEWIAAFRLGLEEGSGMLTRRLRTVNGPGGRIVQIQPPDEDRT